MASTTSAPCHMLVGNVSDSTTSARSLRIACTVSATVWVLFAYSLHALSRRFVVNRFSSLESQSLTPKHLYVRIPNRTETGKGIEDCLFSPSVGRLCTQLYTTGEWWSLLCKHFSPTGCVMVVTASQSG
eukprot:1561070-Amphidinium_carterae.1